MEAANSSTGTLAKTKEFLRDKPLALNAEQIDLVIKGKKTLEEIGADMMAAHGIAAQEMTRLEPC